MNEVIVQSLIDLIVFLEFSDDETVNSDAAVQVLESVSENLSHLTNSDVELFMQIARNYANDFSDPKIKAFISDSEMLIGIRS